MCLHRALLLTPNVLIGSLWGKFVFVAADLGVCWLLYDAVHRIGGRSRHESVVCAATFLLHPFVINVSTRGNADALSCLLVVAVLRAALENHWKCCAVLFVWFRSPRDVAQPSCVCCTRSLGVAAHVRLYPIIYVVPLVLHTAAKHPRFARSGLPWFRRYLGYVNCRAIQFAAAFCVTFGALGLLCYAWSVPCSVV